MPKVKSHRGAAKRVRRTGSGRLVHQKEGKRHILTKKSAKRKRQLRRDGEAEGGNRNRLERLVPYR